MLRKLTKANSSSSRTSSTKAAHQPKPKAAAVAESKPAASKAVHKAAKAPAKDAAKAPAKAPAKEKVAAGHSTKTAPARSNAKSAKATTKPPTKTAASKAATVKAASKGGRERQEFLARQRQLLLDERANYLRSADTLKAQADSLALEHEPGDVQFDEEGGEGGTANVDRELDLVLSAQARAAATEIDRALAKIESGTYGLCEQCGEPIPEARLQALPQAALCVSCKSGGLSSRR
jgi:DnaK suppressor protein